MSLRAPGANIWGLAKLAPLPSSSEVSSWDLYNPGDSGDANYRRCRSTRHRAKIISTLSPTSQRSPDDR